MKSIAFLFALSTLFLSTTNAQVHPRIHRRCASNHTVSATASAGLPPTTLSTSFMLASTPSPLPSTLATSVSASPSPPAASSATASSPATPSTSAGAGTGRQVTINPGDTLEKIAAANGAGICDIVKANGIQDPNLILTGDMLTIPVVRGQKDDKSCLP
ncbi:uncharacterized protein ALTATR162_LOCUS9648 [Alternaria atra]|uniref:LysM domain-containing protein n=1 Tax=Alternaria atra TaxID=119953 RepID=A0A8J2N927_9PLEO|nr:uncharacterized protein ALTATR162_LOCUS9648 [Alternaria atra]CAG5181210.1 unnamed protein product [Alternaria atra]